jgi:uncharacterized membrane protein YtjA (UPF0391 family)
LERQAIVRCGGNVVLQWSLLFFIVALIAALIAFGGLAASAAVAKLFFFVFLTLSAGSLIASLIRSA